VEAYLAAHPAAGAPVFCYVNFQDCHFPYAYPGMERIVVDDLVSRSEIRPENAERVRRTYLNAAANVDRAVERLLAAWTAARGEPALVIVADHGESLFDGGRLGHGTALDRAQTEIVFLARGLPVRCTFPIGLADVREIVRGALAGDATAPETHVDPERWIWQYVGSIPAPQLLGAAAASGGAVYDLRDGSRHAWGAPPRSLQPPFDGAIRLWERILLHRRAH
jgi:arylsulfatase A-like enzyme